MKTFKRHIAVIICLFGLFGGGMNAADNIQLEQKAMMENAFYADELDISNSDDDYIKYFKEKKIYSIDKFNDLFKYKFSTRDYLLIYSTVDLWEGIDSEYKELYNAISVNWASFSVPEITGEEELLEALDRLEYVVTELYEQEPAAIGENYEKILEYIFECTDNPEQALSQKFHLNQTIKNIYACLGAYEKYEYSYSDLRIRYKIKKADNVFWTVINKLEKSGHASPVSLSDEYRQYVNYYGTESAYFLGQQYMGMIGIVYALHGIQQHTANVGQAIRGIQQQRGNLRIATARYNLFKTKIDYAARQQNNTRLLQDIQYQQKRQDKYDGKATETKGWQNRNIAREHVQNEIKEEICEKLDAMYVEEIRVNQTQSDASGSTLGRNLPDIQIKYDDKRYYIEIDAAISNRGAEHYQRIISNDPSAATNNTPIKIQNIIKEVTLKYNCIYEIKGRVILIQMK